MTKIEHIGIAVKDIKASNELFEKLFNTPHYKIEEVIKTKKSPSHKLLETFQLQRDIRLIIFHTSSSPKNHLNIFSYSQKPL